MSSARLTRTARRRLAHTVSYTFLIVVGVTMVFPLLWMLVTSVKSPDADVMNLSKLLPEVSWRVTASDVRHWLQLCRILNGEGQGAAVSSTTKLRNLLDPQLRQTIRSAVARGRVTAEEKSHLVAGLNTIVNTAALWADRELAEAILPEQDRGLAADASRLEVETRRRLNRTILDAVLAGVLAKAHRLHWENYRTALFETTIFRAFLNSVLVTATITVGQVFTSSLAAFAFARLRFFGRDKLFLGYLATMMVPGAVTMIPVFILLRHLGWIDTYYALIIPAMFSAYGTFMLRQFFMTLPRSLEEAAILDGCSTFGVYWHVILPLSKPGLTALAMLTFMGSWRSFMWPLIVSHSERLYTLPVALAGFKEMYGVQWTLLMAGSVIMIIPMLAVFIFGQRFFVEGITIGAVKG